MMYLFKKLTTIFTVFCFSFICVGTASGIAATPASSSSEHISEQVLSERFEEGFRIIFSEVIEQTPSGLYKVRATYKGHLEGLSIDKAHEIATGLNILKGTVEEKGAQDYVKCVLKGLIPGAGLVSIDWGNVYIWIKQRSWGKFSKYLAKHAAKKGLKDLAKLTPWGLASSIPISMVSCAIWG